MILQHSRQLLFVLLQCFQILGRDFLKGRVGRCKDSQLIFTIEGVNETSSFHELNQGAELLIFAGDFDNRLRSLLRLVFLGLVFLGLVFFRLLLFGLLLFGLLLFGLFFFRIVLFRLLLGIILFCVLLGFCLVSILAGLSILGGGKWQEEARHQ